MLLGKCKEKLMSPNYDALFIGSGLISITYLSCLLSAAAYSSVIENVAP